MTKITIDEVKKLAALAKLSISEQEIKNYQEKFDSILEFVSTLNSIDTEGVKPTSQVTGLTNVTRADVIQESQVSTDELLAGAPDSQDGYVKVKRVIE